jgi:hypothetical protein
MALVAGFRHAGFGHRALGQVLGSMLPFSSILMTVPWQLKHPVLRSLSEFMPLFSQGSSFHIISIVLACLDRLYCLASSGWHREQSLGVTMEAIGNLYFSSP